MNSLGEMVYIWLQFMEVFWKVGFTAFIAHLCTLTPISQMLGKGYLNESSQAAWNLSTYFIKIRRKHYDPIIQKIMNNLPSKFHDFIANFTVKNQNKDFINLV